MSEHVTPDTDAHGAPASVGAPGRHARARAKHSTAHSQASSRAASSSLSASHERRTPTPFRTRAGFPPFTRGVKKQQLTVRVFHNAPFAKSSLSVLGLSARNSVPPSVIVIHLFAHRSLWHVFVFTRRRARSTAWMRHLSWGCSSLPPLPSSTPPRPLLPPAVVRKEIPAKC